MGAAMKDVLAAYFDSINSRGGIFTRKIELKVPDAGGSLPLKTLLTRNSSSRSSVV